LCWRSRAAGGRRPNRIACVACRKARRSAILRCQLADLHLQCRGSVFGSCFPTRLLSLNRQPLCARLARSRASWGPGPPFTACRLPWRRPPQVGAALRPAVGIAAGHIPLPAAVRPFRHNNERDARRSRKSRSWLYQQHGAGVIPSSPISSSTSTSRGPISFGRLVEAPARFGGFLPARARQHHARPTLAAGSASRAYSAARAGTGNPSCSPTTVGAISPPTMMLSPRPPVQRVGQRGRLCQTLACWSVQRRQSRMFTPSLTPARVGPGQCTGHSLNQRGLAAAVRPMMRPGRPPMRVRENRATMTAARRSLVMPPRLFDDD